MPSMLQGGMPVAVLYAMILSETEISGYLQGKRNTGASAVTVAKYRTPLYRLWDWLGENKEVSAARLQDWRRSLVAHGYGKITVQKYVTVVNDFFRTVDHAELCIPKPIQNDLTGKTFGDLTVLEATERRKRRDVVWRCVCKCGKEVEVPAVLLKGGNTTSCGCLKPKVLQYANRYQAGTELRRSMTEVICNPNSASGYVGVQPKGGKWAAYITYKKQHYYLGTFSDIEDAVKARARAKEAVMGDAARIWAETDHLYQEAPRRPPKPEKEPPTAAEPVLFPALRSNNTSGHTGVTRRGDKWSATICVRGFRYKLGLYEGLEDAVAVRRRAEALVSAGDLETLKAISTN